MTHKVALVKTREYADDNFYQKVADSISDWVDVTDQELELLNKYSLVRNKEVLIIIDRTSKIPLRVKEYLRCAEIEAQKEEEKKKKREEARKDRLKKSEAARKALYEKLKNEFSGT